MDRVELFARMSYIYVYVRVYECTWYVATMFRHVRVRPNWTIETSTGEGVKGGGVGEHECEIIQIDNLFK